MTRRLRILVADDEPLARKRVLDRLALDDSVEVVAVARSGAQAIDAIRSHRESGSPIDVAFLDIRMPGADGLDVVRSIGTTTMPHTIFVTAYDRHAIDAFQVEALDYLLKPYDDERFDIALARAKRAARLSDAALSSSGLDPTEAKYLERFASDVRGRTRLIPVAQVDFVSAAGPYAELHLADEVVLIRETMQTLESSLDPSLFVRVHRSAIVRIDCIEALLTAPGGNYAARLHSGEEVSVSRSRRAGLARRLGLER